MNIANMPNIYANTMMSFSNTRMFLFTMKKEIKKIIKPISIIYILFPMKIDKAEVRLNDGEKPMSVKFV